MAFHNPPTEAMVRVPTILAVALGGRRVPRSTLEGLVSTLIETPDLADGDPDIEANGDELDGINSEDEFINHGGRGRPLPWSGTGCPIADSDLAIDDGACDGEYAL